VNKDIKMITFDLDDTLWDNLPTITRAEIDTREWIENKVGKVEWGNFDDFLNLREELIKKDKSIKWDISKLRKEIFRKKLNHITPVKFRDEIVENAFDIFINKRHEVKFFDGVENALKLLSRNYILGVLTNGNADIFKFDIGKYFKFFISSLEAKIAN
jgi:Predicted hydrolase (HAD superfamily)